VAAIESDEDLTQLLDHLDATDGTLDAETLQAVVNNRGLSLRLRSHVYNRFGKAVGFEVLEGFSPLPIADEVSVLVNNALTGFVAAADGGAKRKILDGALAELHSFELSVQSEEGSPDGEALKGMIEEERNNLQSILDGLKD